MKNCRRVQGKVFLLKMRYLWTKNMRGVTDKDEILHRGQDSKTTFLSVMVQISPIFFNHRSQAQNHVTFNCDQIYLSKVKVIYKYLTPETIVSLAWMGIDP